MREYKDTSGLNLGYILTWMQCSHQVIVIQTVVGTIPNNNVVHMYVWMNKRDNKIV